MSAEISPLLVHSPDVCRGCLCMNGTRMAVYQTVVWYTQGYSPEERADQYPPIPAQPHTACCAKGHEETILA
jgi:uncharacterized protein (DUF433 family)